MRWGSNEFVEMKPSECGLEWTLVVVSREINFQTLSMRDFSKWVCDEKKKIINWDDEESGCSTFIHSMKRKVMRLSLSFHTDTNKHLTDKATLSLYDTHLWSVKERRRITVREMKFWKVTQTAVWMRVRDENWSKMFAIVEREKVETAIVVGDWSETEEGREVSVERVREEPWAAAAAFRSEQLNSLSVQSNVKERHASFFLYTLSNSACFLCVLSQSNSGFCWFSLSPSFCVSSIFFWSPPPPSLSSFLSQNLFFPSGSPFLCILFLLLLSLFSIIERERKNHRKENEQR